FVQAEDGIRYDLVTGVQTCALPISRRSGSLRSSSRLPKARREETGKLKFLSANYFRRGGKKDRGWMVPRKHCLNTLPYSLAASRSEERRVGKEDRSVCTQKIETKKK